MSGERESSRPPVLIRFAVGALTKSYEDLKSWTGQVREDISRLPDEIKKIPVSLASLPVQAVTDAVSSALRLQQNFNALVIKGDETLDLIFHKPEDKPEWATFDEDEDDEIPAPAALSEPKNAAPIVTPIAKAKPEAAKLPATELPKKAAAPVRKPATGTARATTKPAAGKPATRKPSASKPPVSKPKTEKPATEKPVALKPPAPPKAEPPKPPASKPSSAVKKPAAAEKPVSQGKPAAPKPPAPPKAEPPKATATAKGQGSHPELVDYLEYETISLAQLRARARNLSIPELRELLSFERANGNRPPFVTLLENRITTSGA